MEPHEEPNAYWWTQFRETCLTRGCDPDDAVLCRFDRLCACRRQTNAVLVVEGLMRLAALEPL